MKCPKCNEEALFVNGKYVCVDCGIEITPEEQANQYSSDDLLDASPNVAASNPITDPDPQVSRSFNVVAADNQSQLAVASDPNNSIAVPVADDTVTPKTVQVPTTDPIMAVSDPVISETPVAESVITPTSDPTIPISTPPASEAVDQPEMTQASGEADIKKPVEDYYKSELEKTEKPLEGMTAGSGIYDFTAVQSAQGNQEASPRESLESLGVQAQVETPDFNQTSVPPAEVPVYSSVSPIDPTQSGSDLSIEPPPIMVDPDADFSSRQPQATEPISGTEAEVRPGFESLTSSEVPDFPLETDEAKIKAESRVDESARLENQPEESGLINQDNLNQNLDEPVVPSVSPPSSADGFSIPVQTEETAAIAAEPHEIAPGSSPVEPTVEDPVQPEIEGEGASQGQSYFQPSTFEMNANNEAPGLSQEVPTADFESEIPEINNEELGLNTNQGESTSLGEPPLSEAADVATPGLMTPNTDEVSDQPALSQEIPVEVNSAETPNDPQEYSKGLDDLLNQPSQTPQTNSEDQVSSDVPSPLEGQTSDSSSVDFSVADIKKEGPMPTVESVFGNSVEGEEDAPMPQDYGLPAPKPPDEKKKKIILVGSLVGGLLLIVVVVSMIFLFQPKNPYPIVLGAEAITTLSSNITNTMDEKQDIAVRYKVEADYGGLEIKNSEQKESDSRVLSYSASGDWLADKVGNIHVLSSENGLNNKQTYMAGRSSTFVFDETDNKWKKNDGNTITSLPSYISPNSRSSAVYAQNIQNITWTGTEEIGGASTRVYEIKPSKSYIESVNFLGPKFSTLSYVSLDSSKLNVKIWIGANDNKIYKLELSGNLIIESEEFSGEIGLTTSATYEYRSVLISNPEETAKEGPPELIIASYVFKTEDGRPSSVNENFFVSRNVWIS